ncbi:hypothetical protein ACR9VJ_26235 [Streptomyces sp. H49]|uniref:hypothetical protein n=1 Tax=Streptomyces sp. H49 TaxID=3444117 RepID=UPI003F4AE94C
MDQQFDLDAIQARANAATPGPWEEHPQYGAHFYAYLRGPYLRGVGTLNFGDGEDAEADREFVKHAREDVEALVAEVRRLRDREAALTTLADRWQQMADHGDAAIGHFEGPAAATLDAEVGERGRTYRKAASDIRDVLRTGRIPHDLMTDDELNAAAPAARSAAV